MSFIKDEDLYSLENTTPVLIGIIFFAFQSVITLMDVNTYIKDFGISEGTISRGRFLYTYVSGFLTYIIKITLALLTIYVLLSIIRCALVITFFILTGEETSNSVGKMLRDALQNNLFYVYSIYLFDGFMYMFLAAAPVLMLTILAGFAILIYNASSIQELEDNNKSERALNILNTLHHHMMFFIAVTVVCLIIAMIGTYISELFARHPAELVYQNSK